VYRDLEAQLVIVTKNQSLRQQLHNVCLTEVLVAAVIVLFQCIISNNIPA